jgi:hypothetical protein
MNSTVRSHLEGRRLEEHAADDEEVLGFWKKALIARTDAINATTSLENRLLRAYDAARLAATAIVRVAGYRTRRTDSHHHVTFDVARSVVADRDLRRALDGMNSLRKVRHEVEYEPEGEVDDKTLAHTLQNAEQVISLARLHLEINRADLAGRLSSY